MQERGTADCHNKFNDCYFPLKKNIEKKIFNSVVGAFFLLLILPMMRRLRVAEQKRWWLVNYICALTPPFDSLTLAGSNLSNPSFNHIFYMLSGTR